MKVITKKKKKKGKKKGREIDGDNKDNGILSKDSLLEGHKTSKNKNECQNSSTLQL